jgi:hypothetical protein
VAGVSTEITEIEEPGTETPHEIEATSAQLAAIEEERGWFRGVIKGGLIGFPIGALAFVGLVAISLVGQGFEMKSMLVVAAIVGLNAGAFFGPWAAVVAHAHKVDEADARAAHHG